MASSNSYNRPYARKAKPTLHGTSNYDEPLMSDGEIDAQNDSQNSGPAYIPPTVFHARLLQDDSSIPLESRGPQEGSDASQDDGLTQPQILQDSSANVPQNSTGNQPLYVLDSSILNDKI